MSWTNSLWVLPERSLIVLRDVVGPFVVWRVEDIGFGRLFGCLVFGHDSLAFGLLKMRGRVALGSSVSISSIIGRVFYARVIFGLFSGHLSDLSKNGGSALLPYIFTTFYLVSSEEAKN